MEGSLLLTRFSEPAVRSLSVHSLCSQDSGSAVSSLRSALLSQFTWNFTLSFKTQPTYDRLVFFLLLQLPLPPHPPLQCVSVCVSATVLIHSFVLDLLNYVWVSQLFYKFPRAEIVPGSLIGLPECVVNKILIESSFLAFLLSFF